MDIPIDEQSKMFVIKGTATSGGMQTKPSINPKEISICDCKEMLMGTVNDAIEILGDVGAEICIRDL